VSFKLLEQVSLPGDPAKPNEDSFAALDHAALVLDGATPLGPSLLPGPSDAAWIAQFGARRLSAHLKDGDVPEDALKHALQDAEKSFAGLQRAPIREKWQTPCASMMMAFCDDPLRPSHLGGATATSPSSVGARGGGGSRPRSIQFLWYGDCTALIEQDGKVEVVGEAVKSRKAEAGRAKRAAKGKNLSSALGVNRPEIEPLLRAARNRVNSGSNWLFSPDPRAAKHVARQTVTVSEGARLLLASDGFLALVSDYGAYDIAGLMQAALGKGLAALTEELRVIEKSDAAGERFFRFKASDDATALLLQLI
jgi:serine/threonine protein phosphatase PrpC